MRGWQVWLGLGMLMAVVVWRVAMWQATMAPVLVGEPIKLRLQLMRPIGCLDYGCAYEWRGWRLMIDLAMFDSSRLGALSAGDEIDLEVRLRRDSLKYRQLWAISVVPVATKQWPVVSLGWWLRLAWETRERVVIGMRQVMPEREASLVAGILLGVKSELSERFYEALVKTGTMHVVAASGYNISVVAAAAMSLLLRFFSRFRAALLTFGFVWVYVLVTGADPPIVRAGLMGSLVLFSWLVGREVWVLFGYIMTGLGMLVVSPWLLQSVSFQLSMAATAGVIWVVVAIQQACGPVADRLRLRHGVIVGGLWENLVTTVAATLAVWPLLMLHFGEVSLLGLVVNPFVLGLVPLIMYLGMVHAVLAFVWFPLGQLVGWLTIPVARIWIEVVMFAGGWGGSGLSWPINWWWVGGWWLVLMGWVLVSLKQ